MKLMLDFKLTLKKKVKVQIMIVCKLNVENTSYDCLVTFTIPVFDVCPNQA